VRRCSIGSGLLDADLEFGAELHLFLEDDTYAAFAHVESPPLERPKRRPAAIPGQRVEKDAGAQLVSCFAAAGRMDPGGIGPHGHRRQATAIFHELTQHSSGRRNAGNVQRLRRTTLDAHRQGG
jgi:hypothetical protein